MGSADYEEWFDSIDIASAPLGEVAGIIAELYRDLFEVCHFITRCVIHTIAHAPLRIRRELDRIYKCPAHNGRSGPTTTPEEFALASCASPDCTPTTAREFTLRSWWLLCVERERLVLQSSSRWRLMLLFIHLTFSPRSHFYILFYLCGPSHL